MRDTGGPSRLSELGYGEATSRRSSRAPSSSSACSCAPPCEVTAADLEGILRASL